MPSIKDRDGDYVNKFFERQTFEGSTRGTYGSGSREIDREEKEINCVISHTINRFLGCTGNLRVLDTQKSFEKLVDESDTAQELDEAT